MRQLQRRGLGVLLVLSLLPAWSGTALAGSERDVTGPYLGLGFSVGQGVLTELPGGRNDDGFSTGLGANAWVGYRLLRWLSFELQVEYLDRINDSDQEMAALMGSANLRLYLQHERWHAFLLAGPGAGNWVTDLPGRGSMDTAFAARFGAGLDYDLTQHVALVTMGSYVHMYSNLEGFDYWSLTFGAQYRF